MYNKIKNKLKQYEFIKVFYDNLLEFYYRWLVTDKKLITRKFKKRLGRNVELENPIKFNDKLQWLKLNWYDPIAAKCADKFEVREFVRSKIGNDYLNELLATYENVKEIDLDKLPNKFVLKGTHGSGFNIICEDKYKMNWKDEFKKMRRWLRKNYFYQNREWVYKDLKPRIICEKYLSDENDNSLTDYKVHCFNGEPKFIQVDFDRYKEHKKNLYDLEWNFIDVEYNYPNDKSANINKPEKLNEILEISKRLSEGFPYARIDSYIVNNNVVFGEITFFPASGMGYFSPDEFEEKIGSWLNLPKKIN